MGLRLTRQVGKSIFIDGDKIKITINRINGRQVTLDIVAPKEIVIDREEIYEKKLDESIKNKKNDS